MIHCTRSSRSRATSESRGGGVLGCVIALPALILAPRRGGTGSALIVVLSIAALWAYQWYLLSTTGQTLGKRWSGIRIVKVDGSPLTFVSAVLVRSWAVLPEKNHPSRNPSPPRRDCTGANGRCAATVAEPEPRGRASNEQR
jgi:hypothetical protein